MKKTAVLIFILALIPRMLLTGTSYWTNPDALEYINVTANFAEGKGFTKSVKIHHFDETPVVRSAVGTKPVLFSLFLTPFYLISSNPYFLQFIVLITAALSVVLFYILTRHYLNERWAVAATILFSFYPDYLISSRLILSEPLYLVLLFTSLLLFIKRKPTYWLGLTAVLAYLTRTEGVFLFAVLIFELVRKREWKYLKNFAFYYFIFNLPYALINYQINGNPFFNVGNYHFITLNFLASAYSNYGVVFPSALEFFINNWQEVVLRIADNGKALFSSVIRLSGAGVLFVAALFLTQKRKYLFLILLAFFHFLTFSITWGLVMDAPRYTTLIVPFVILFAVVALSKYPKTIAAGVLSLTLLFYLAFSFHRINWARGAYDSTWESAEAASVAENIVQNTRQVDVVAASNPRWVYLKAKRSAVLLPVNLDQELFEDFNLKYSPTMLLLDSTKTETFQSALYGGWELEKIGGWWIAKIP